MHSDDQPRPQPQPCAELRVVDLTQGMSGPMATMILADYGARVIKVEPPGGDWARQHLRGFHMWNRGKESIVLDLARQRSDLSRLLRWADVVVTDARPSIATRFGLDRAAIEADNPAIVHCHVGTWAGADDDDRPVFEAQLSAATGQMTGLDVLSGRIVDPSRSDPTFTLPPTSSYGAAMLAVQGILAALIARGREVSSSTQSSNGEYLETSLLQGAMTFLMRQGLARPVPRSVEPADDLIHRGIELCFLTAECADGRYVQMCARQDHHFRLWLRALGLESVLDEPRFARAPMGIGSLADVESLERLLRERMRTRTQAEWMHLFTTEYDLGADPFLTPQEFLAHPQMVDNARVATINDPVLGRVTELGMLVEIDGSTRTEFDPAPELGQHSADIREVLLSQPAEQPVVPTHALRALPLEGVTVLEVAYFVAGPLATTLLAEMGARVIKVEPLDGDPYRRTGLQSTKFLTGKESIALDLKRPGGQAVLHELIRRSDAMVHSFRAGVPERLSMDEATARSLRSDIVYLNAASYGSRGPESGRIAFHSTPTALSGAGIAQAGRGNKPVDDSFPDPAAGLGAATALMLGLFARGRTGEGAALETTMLSSAGYVMSNDTVMADGRVDALIADHDQLGLSACYRLYECSDEWIFLAAVTAAHTAGLREAMDLDEGDFADDDALSGLLAKRFAQDTAQSWVARLGRHGVPVSATSSDSFDLWLEQHDMLTAAEHEDFPPFYQMVRKVGFADRPAVPRPVCSVGEHTRDILVELGFDDLAIQALVEDGAVGGVESVRM
ncbi:MAG: CoA transferase [Ilumatobacteraceae bacterium]